MPLGDNRANSNGYSVKLANPRFLSAIPGRYVATESGVRRYDTPTLYSVRGPLASFNLALTLSGSGPGPAPAHRAHRADGGGEETSTPAQYRSPAEAIGA